MSKASADILEYMNSNGVAYIESAETEEDVFAIFYGDAWLRQEFAAQYGYAV